MGKEDRNGAGGSKRTIVIVRIFGNQRKRSSSRKQSKSESWCPLRCPFFSFFLSDSKGFRKGNVKKSGTELGSQEEGTEVEIKREEGWVDAKVVLELA